MNADQFCRARLRLNLTQAQLATRLNAGKRTIERFEAEGCSTITGMAMKHLEGQSILKGVLADMWDLKVPSHVWLRIASLIEDERKEQ